MVYIVSRPLRLMPIRIYRVVDCCLVVGQELAITKPAAFNRSEYKRFN